MSNERFYIYHGAKVKMYTLRVEFEEPTYYKSEYGVQETGAIAKDHYVMTLTADPVTAADKANAWLEEAGYAQRVEVPDFNLEDIHRTERDWRIFQGGKYEGHSVYEVIEQDPEYAIWAAQNMSGERYAGTVMILQELLGPQLRVLMDERESAARASMRKEFDRAAILAPYAEAMRDGQGGFRDSIADGLARGSVPSGRGRAITLDILAKMHGRRNSNAYEDAYQQASDAFTQAESM